MPARGHQTSEWSAASLLAALLVVCAVIFGGASQRNTLQLALVELAALPLLAVALYRLILTAAWRNNRAALVVAALVLAVPLLQLIPLPPQLWTTLPGRDQAVLALELLGQSPGWGPLSLAPDATRAALWALLPPVAMLVGMMVLDLRSRLIVGGVFLTGAVASVLLAAAQLASGSEALYLYSHSGAGEVNGFSSNRNHLATLVLMGLPIAAAVGASPHWAKTRNDSAGRWLFGLYAVLAVLAIGLTRSRTGIVLAGPVLIASLLLIWHATRQGGAGWKALGLAALAGTGVAAVAAFGLAPILDRFDALQDGPDLRFEAWPIVIEAGNGVQPWGAGLGAFDPVFRAVEPLSALGPLFWNRAHNDYLELWLETGVIGLIVLALVLAWFARAWAAAWALAAPRQAPLLARAAGLAILVVLAHSIVDYPARTETIAVFLAFCLGALTPPPSWRDPTARTTA